MARVNVSKHGTIFDWLTALVCVCMLYLSKQARLRSVIDALLRSLLYAIASRWSRDPSRLRESLQYAIKTGDELINFIGGVVVRGADTGHTCFEIDVERFAQVVGVHVAETDANG